MYKIFRLLYRLYLKKKFAMKPAGASLLTTKFLNDYKEYGFFKTLKIHLKGFTVEDWNILNLNMENCSDYMSNAEYFALHPINGIFSSWIDDKLTLKMLFRGTELDKYMPRYYYHIDENGQILCLPDCEDKKGYAEAQDIIDLLEKEKALAIKLLNGSIGKGFYKAEYDNGVYLLNDKECTKEELLSEISSLKNYIITEYFYPHSVLAEFYDKTLNPIRFLAGKSIGETLHFLKGFLRIGTIKTGPVENYNCGGILCYIDEEGWFEKGNILERERERENSLYM